MSSRPAVSRSVLVAVLVCCASACGLPAPEQIADGWETADPASVGLSEAILDQLVRRVDEGVHPNVHSILIVRNDKLVFERYWPGYLWDFYGQDFRGAYSEFGRDNPHNLASVTKSITSALVGIAIDRGYIPDVDQELFSYFPEYIRLRNAENRSITLKDLLTMTAGLEWNGLEIPINTRDPRHDVLQLFAVDDPLAYILAKPIVSTPGTSWYYNAGETVLLGEVIHRASGMRMDEFAEQYLFGPLGISVYEWFYINPQTVYAAGNLRLRPRDMAKIGYLFLQGGVWEGERVISEDWVGASTEPHVSTWWASDYGYQWWVDRFPTAKGEVQSYFADGWGGQRIMVFPAERMVVVFTGGNYVQLGPIDEILAEYILPAIRD